MMRRLLAQFGTPLALLLAVAIAPACGQDTSTGDDDAGATSSSGGADGIIGGDDDGGALNTDGATSSSGGETDGSASGASSSGGDVDADTGSSGADATQPLDCPGGAGCKCDKNDECDTSYCLDFPEGKQCAQLCTETCPQGLECKDISGGSGDKVFACVSPFVALCAACSDDQFCQQNGVKGACIDYGAEGRFCGGPCETDAECPTDYECIDAEGTGGATSKQCKRKADAAEPVCGCSEWAVTNGASTMCGKTNSVGTCKAERKCTTDGLQPCTAADAKPEECNALDDDCNGTADDLAADFKCSNKLFAELGSMATCTSDGDCAATGAAGAVEKCDLSGVIGACKTLQGECFGIPSCTAGGKLLCNEAKTPLAEACDLQDNDCDGLTDETFTVKAADDKLITMGQPCGTGECGGGNVVCETLQSAVCSTSKKAGDEKCDGLDNDCDGETDDKGVVCSDGNACTADECDPQTGDCTNPESVKCDDNNACTADSCDTKKGECIHALTDGASCDDGDACSVGDVCAAAGDGAATCLPGTATKVCDDANLCTDDSCDPKTGCVGLANAATQACFSGEPKTLDVGECTGGVQLCSEGALQGACVGEVTANNKEICDAKDDNCDGIIDNGCAANVMQLRTATVAGKIADAKVQMALRGGGEGALHGQASGAKTSASFGWYAWLQSFSK